MNFFMVLAVTLGECRVWNGLPFGGDMPIAYDKVIFPEEWVILQWVLSNFKL